MNNGTNERIALRHAALVSSSPALLFVALVAIVKFSVTVPAVDADRATVRSKDLAEIRAAEATALATPGWVDKDRAASCACQLTRRCKFTNRPRQNPAAARADLTARAEKAAAPAPKKAAAPNPFE